MSVQYICELYFDKHKSDWQELMKLSLHSLGFIPNVMSIYVTMDKMFEEIPYDENFLFSVLSKEDEPGITIRHHIYDEDSENPWFRLGDTEGKFVSLKWSNTNLDFLLSENIEQFFKMDGFTVGYAFDNKDIREQSREATEKGGGDYTIYPGQYKYVCGMQFMAAPLMWFGKPFFEIISKDKLLKFNKAHIKGQMMHDLIEVELFNIYDSPEKTENRINQKSFWSFFDLGKIISKFEEDNAIDAVKSLKDFLAKNQSRKK
jgi:hypothetical protein